MENANNNQSSVPTTAKALFEIVCAQWLVNATIQPLNLGYVHKIAAEFNCAHLATDCAELFRETLKDCADAAAQLGKAGALKAGRQVSWVWCDCTIEVPRQTERNSLPEFRVTPTVFAAFKHLGAARDSIVQGVKAPALDLLIAQLGKSPEKAAPTQKQIQRAFEILEKLGFTFDEVEKADALARGRVSSDEKEKD